MPVLGKTVAKKKEIFFHLWNLSSKLRPLDYSIQVVPFFLEDKFIKFSAQFGLIERNIAYILVFLISKKIYFNKS